MESKRKVDYHNLRNPFPPLGVFSEDRIQDIHEKALDVLENLGMKVLLPEARAIFRSAGALVDEKQEIVRIGREIVESAIDSAPQRISLIAGSPKRNLVLELGVLTFLAGAGAPNATDLKRGRRPGSLADFRELVKITQQFDVLQILNPVVEAQDIPVNLRHYAFTESQMKLSDKFPFVYSRGSAQVSECFEMIANFRDASEDEFRAAPHCYTIINTNSPRMLDKPMAQGIIDFARHRQLTVVTPFCLMGAMAPITVAGALLLSHAECLGSIALNQLSGQGAPVCYGAFASNVDMKSGAPAFGTPEQVKANLGSGQLARLVGLPWRCATGSAANINDAQAANETQMGAWGCLLAGSTLVVHAAGWIEGGLTISFEKFVTDLEMVQMLAELCIPSDELPEDLALDAILEVDPGGHFFGCKHTMERYQTAFYEPLVADWSNFGAWTEAGGSNASERALGIWQDVLRRYRPPKTSKARCEELDQYIAARTSQGGADPLD